MSDTFAALGSWRPGGLPSRAEAVREAIRRGIVTGELAPGRPLVESELAARLGVSKTPVREALKTLVGTGLVVVLPYKGATVRPVDEALARAVYDMRLLLEPVAAARAGYSVSALAQARSALDAADAAALDAAGGPAGRFPPPAGHPFHRALYSGCGNPLLVRKLDELSDQAALVAGAAWARPPSWAQEAREHREILAAAENGDCDRVRALMRNHIRAFLVRNFPRDVAEEQPGQGAGRRRGHPAASA